MRTLLIASVLASANAMVIPAITSKVDVSGSGALQVTAPLRSYAGACLACLQKLSCVRPARQEALSSALPRARRGEMR